MLFLKVIICFLVHSNFKDVSWIVTTLKIFSLGKHFFWSPRHKLTNGMLIDKIGNYFPPVIIAFITFQTFIKKKTTIFNSA